MFSGIAYPIFEQSIKDYHLYDSVEQPVNNPFLKSGIEHLLYAKNWVDTVQWHYEDIIRHPDIDAVEALVLKRKIDASNQLRTDMVEQIDDYFLEQYKAVQFKDNATINTESPAWAIDRLSVLALKIFHMEQETLRTDAPPGHMAACLENLNILQEQKSDLCTAIDTLLNNIANGNTYMKVYRQMKMYNDGELNPVLYKNKK
ncbi:MAG: DUF4254 domain-containing protein [Bacteroidia bacterium]